MPHLLNMSFMLSIKQEIDDVFDENTSNPSNTEVADDKLLVKCVVLLDKLSDKVLEYYSVPRHWPTSDSQGHEKTCSSHQEQEYSCIECGKCFSRKDHCRKHEKSHSGAGEYPCMICDKKFAVRYRLKRHVMTVHAKTKPYSCDKCHKQFALHRQLEGHKITHSAGLYACSNCDKTFRRQSYLIEHELTHADVKPFQCADCQKTFSHLHHLKQHVLSHSDPSAMWPCCHCGKQFTCKYSVEAHEKIHNLKRLSCGVCDKTFARSADLTIHSRLHTGLKKHMCTYCNHQFSKLGDLNRHLLTHTGEKPHMCVDCGERFARSDRLKLHRVRKHGLRTVLQCEHCNMVFTLQYELKRHLFSHATIWPYSCNMCDKCFPSADRFREHFRTHFNVGQFGCGRCGQIFRDRRSVFYHFNNSCPLIGI